jgi:ABC-type antimicrobial peptide transport system permease subunit
MILASALVPVMVGSVCGAVAAALGVRLLHDFLFGVAPIDPAAFALAAALLVSVGTVAAFVPALRATRIDPLRALRAQ